MPEPVRDLLEMLQFCTPVLHDDIYVYARLPQGRQTEDLAAFAVIREDEGVTVILEKNRAVLAGLEIVLQTARITLTVYSALDGVGLTAAFAAALAEQGIGCNVVAAIHHDHIFVPLKDAQRALTALLALQNKAETHGCGKLPPHTEGAPTT
ncbi:ACT domain-containing protein [Castellaniella sp.]|uniref:ACT domain-containing protein n=1 Tax=Castellaniella sp. TaxID=1955812 RepID=UPI002AFF1B90|nr:ACT domain-containing protein [Castellaniella sp.]